jgi:hypothetical protein
LADNFLKERNFPDYAVYDRSGMVGRKLVEDLTIDPCRRSQGGVQGCRKRFHRPLPDQLVILVRCRPAGIVRSVAAQATGRLSVSAAASAGRYS